VPRAGVTAPTASYSYPPKTDEEGPIGAGMRLAHPDGVQNHRPRPGIFWTSRQPSLTR